MNATNNRRNSTSNCGFRFKKLQKKPARFCFILLKKFNGRLTKQLVSFYLLCDTKINIVCRKMVFIFFLFGFLFGFSSDEKKRLSIRSGIKVCDSFSVVSLVYQLLSVDHVMSLNFLNFKIAHKVSAPKSV